MSGAKWLQFAYGHRFSQLDSAGGYGPKQVELTWMGRQLSVWEAVRLRPGELSPEERAQLPSVRSEIRRNFPEAIRADEGADWSQWPGDASVFRQ